MGFRLATVTKHFKDEDGNEIEDAGFTIRKRPSYKSQQDYSARLASVSLDMTAFQKANEKGDQDAMTKMIMDLPPDERRVFQDLSGQSIRDHLISVTGLEWEDGREVTVEDFQDYDALFVGQVLSAIQENTSKATPPNSERPSRPSSRPKVVRSA